MDGDGVDELATHDLCSILSGEGRDFLVRNTGDQVKIETLKGKKVGLYFSASWCGPCKRFTPKLVEAYNDLSSQSGDFEVVFISRDGDDEKFNGYFSKMPWLAVPFADSEIRHKLDRLFEVWGIPNLVILDEQGKVLTDAGVEIIYEYGADSYPFTQERIKELPALEEEARKNQTIRSILGSKSRDYVMSNDGKNVPISELEGKVVGLFFNISSYSYCTAFKPSLIAFYNKLKTKGESFVVVSIPLDDDDEESFQKGFEGMPWFSLPFKDRMCEKLARYFEVSTLPIVVIIGPDGKTLHQNVADTIEDYGVQGYPFTPEKFKELEELQKAKEEAQTLESVLVAGDLDFVIDKNGSKIVVSDLVGKNIFLYFSASWGDRCPLYNPFLPKLIEVYHKIKEENGEVEVIFISSDEDQAHFDDFFASMPWLALPFGDTRKAPLRRYFKVKELPTLVALGPTGKTVTTEARDFIKIHGAEAYPFTNERFKEIEARFEEMAIGWPEKVKHPLHEEHELERKKRASYVCHECDEDDDDGHGWAFCCDECGFTLHPKCAFMEMTKGWPEKLKHPLHEEHELEHMRCDGHTCDGCQEDLNGWAFGCDECDFSLHYKCALENDKKEGSEEDGNEGPKEGWVCDGDVCVKAT